MSIVQYKTPRELWEWMVLVETRAAEQEVIPSQVLEWFTHQVMHPYFLEAGQVVQLRVSQPRPETPA